MTEAITLEAALSAIQRDNAQLNVIVDLTNDPGEIAAGDGTLSGIPIAIKSNIAVRGLPFTAGIRGFVNRIAESDAAVVAALRAKGAAIVGTTNMDEAALGATTNNPYYGRTENPRRLGYTAGGSSGGSAAAVAAGFCRAALGTDSLGSCRIPAAYCGVVGYKPSRNLISLDGVEPLSRRLDHVGIFANSVEDVRLIADAVCDFDSQRQVALAFAPLEPPTGTLRHCHLAVLDEKAIRCLSPQVENAYRRGLANLSDAGAVLFAREFDTSTMRTARRAGLFICEADLAVSLRELLADNRESVSPKVRSMIEFATARHAPDLAGAIAIVEAMQEFEHRILDDVDALVWPTVPHVSFPFSEAVPHDQADLTCLANFSGAPAVSLPLPVCGSALPVGIQVQATLGADTRLFAIARAIEVCVDQSRSVGEHRW